MADSQLILELMFLHIRGGCSLTVLLFFLMLVGTSCGFLTKLHLMLENNLRAVLGSELENLQILRISEKLGILVKRIF